MKKIATLFILLLSINIYSQKDPNYTFGEPTFEELNMQKYDLDSTANAVAFYESGTTIFKMVKHSVIISTKFYKKVKLFNREGFEHATFEIFLFNDDNYEEKVIDIRAITHNNLTKTTLHKTQIFEKKINENFRKVSFTMPNLMAGSVIEVEYTVETPPSFNLNSWVFQSSIPKKYSLYKASIPLNFTYNRMLNGYLKLSVNSSEIVNDCFKVPELNSIAGCEVATYAMENIPAFVEEEYMTDKDNFISKIEFQIAKVLRFDGFNKNYTTTWEDVDNQFKKDKNIGKQLKKMPFFENKLPPNLELLPSELDKAKVIYNFIQNHYNWNEKDGIYRYVNLKEAYKSKIGDVSEINISLINALKAAGLDAELMLISTRDNGTPTKVYPIITEFNYVIAKLNIDKTSYLLDATNKLTPFGMLPFKCLNSYGRVMDFENKSYWYVVVPISVSKTQLYVSMKLNKDGIIKGKIRKASFGYDALFRREHLLNLSEDEIKAEFESTYNNLEVINYNVSEKATINKPLVETFEFEIEIDEDATTLYFNPFLSVQFPENPFTQNNRLFPVNFGYPSKYTLNFTLEIPDNFSVESFPDSEVVSLPDKKSYFSLATNKDKNSNITLNSTIVLNKPIYYSTEYESLKFLFSHIIKSQKTPISLKKN